MPRKRAASKGFTVPDIPCSRLHTAARQAEYSTIRTKLRINILLDTFLEQNFQRKLDFACRRAGGEEAGWVRAFHSYRLTRLWGSTPREETSVPGRSKVR